MSNPKSSSVPSAKQSKRLSIMKTRTTKSYILPTTEEDFPAHYVVIPPDGGWGWVVVVVAFLCNFLIDGTTYTFGLFLDDISESFHVHATKVAIANSLMSGFYYFAGPLSCGLSNRYGFRVVAMLGGLIGAATFCAASYITDLTAFLIVIGFCGGVGFNMVYTPCLLVVGFYFAKWRALATALSVTGTAIGIMAFPPLIENLLEQLDWRWKFRILSGLCLVIVALVMVFRPIKPTRVYEEKKVTFLPDDEVSESSIGSFHMEPETETDAHTFSIKKIFERFHNALFPTIAQYSSSQSNTSRRNTEEVSTFLAILPESNSEASFTRSCFISKPDGASTAADDTEADEQKTKCCDFKKCRRTVFFCCRAKDDPNRFNRPLYRDDIFYAGSLYYLPEFKRSRSKITVVSKAETALGYHLSVTRVMTQKDLEESTQCVCCPEAFVRALTTMLDYKLLKSPSFVVLTLSGFFTMIGLYVPFVFIVQRGQELNLGRDWSTKLLMIMGISNTVGRVACGVISCIPRLDALTVSYVTLFITATMTMASCYMNNLEGQIAFTIIFGANIALRHCVLS